MSVLFGYIHVLFALSKAVIAQAKLKQNTTRWGENFDAAFRKDKNARLAQAAPPNPTSKTLVEIEVACSAVRKLMAPITIRMIPRISFLLIFSLKNITENKTTKNGVELVREIAFPTDVFCSVQ